MKKEFWKNEKKQTQREILIVDGYVDEPSLLGVPPYISPEPRFLAGVAEEEGLDWEYISADEYRVNGLPMADYVLVHGGVTVPGTYLSGTPLNPEEAEEVARAPGETFLGGPLARYEDVGGYDHYAEKDLAAFFHDHLKGEAEDRWMTSKEIERWSKKGAKVVERHPMHPDPLIAEVGLYRGCPRYFTGGCSFCSETDYGRPRFRTQENVVKEMEALYELGLRNFRIGGQSCVLSYRANGIGKTEVPTPRPEEIRKLFEGIERSCPETRVLHLDNANPAVIAEHSRRAKEILEILVKHTSPGNILALGMESADPEVIQKNNLNATPDQVEKSVRIMNEIGREKGENGMPKLLPGINFLAGLHGERPKTYEMNFRFLKRLKEKNLWIRRINIRQAISKDDKFEVVDEAKFKKFKEKVREKIDRPLLKEMFPQGTVLKDVYMEKKEGERTFGRQIGTYPLLVGINYPLELGKYYDVSITGYGYRSVTGIHQPLRISEASFKQILEIPGIGEKDAGKIFREIPESREGLKEIIPSKAEKISQYISFE